MKIIHCADIHLDSALTTKFDVKKSAVRRRELLAAFVDMVRYADSNGVEAIIIAGDLFDTAVIDRATAEVVYDLIVKYADIDFYYLQGNHERDGFISFMKKVPDNLLLFGEEWISYIANDRRKGNIVVTGINLENLRESDFENVCSDSIFGELELEEEEFNIVVLHGEFNERKFSGRNIDYLALGHIHEYRDGRIDARGIWCYPGCLAGRGFDECGRHGFVLLDIDENAGVMKRKFIEMSERTTDRIYVDISDCRTSMQIADAIEKEIFAENVTKDSVIRIVLCGEMDVDSSIDVAFIEKVFEGRFFHFEIEDDTGLRVDESNYENDKTLKGEYVRMVMKKPGLSETDRREIIRIGLKALAGEEI